jgi:hypothetical protein
MHVKVYDVTTNGSEMFRAHCDHSDCFPDDEIERQECLRRLQCDGRYWTGGGAVPLTLIMRAE